MLYSLFELSLQNPVYFIRTPHPDLDQPHLNSFDSYGWPVAALVDSTVLDPKLYESKVLSSQERRQYLGI